MKPPHLVRVLKGPSESRAYCSACIVGELRKENANSIKLTGVSGVRAH